MNFGQIACEWEMKYACIKAKISTNNFLTI